MTADEVQILMARMDSFEKESDSRFDALEARLASIEAKSTVLEAKTDQVVLLSERQIALMQSLVDQERADAQQRQRTTEQLLGIIKALVESEKIQLGFSVAMVILAAGWAGYTAFTWGDASLGAASSSSTSPLEIPGGPHPPP